MPSETTFEEVNKALAANAIIYVDVRNPAELTDDGKIAGSVNLPLPEIQEGLALSPADFAVKYGFPKPDLSANLVVGCRSGKRASTAANALEALGYSNIMVYTGSFLDWKEKGGLMDKKKVLKSC